MSIYDSEFTSEEANSADKAANRINTNGAYLLTIVRVQREENQSGSMSAEIFLTDDGGKANFTHKVVVEKVDGSPEWGLPILKSVAYLTGTKLSNPVKGLGMFWEDGKRVEKEGEVFKGFEGKKIGVVLQKELKDNEKWSMNPALYFDWASKLTASEKKDGVSNPVKVANFLKTLRDKDSRKNKVNAKPDVFGEGETGSVFGS